MLSTYELRLLQLRQSQRRADMAAPDAHLEDDDNTVYADEPPTKPEVSTHAATSIIDSAKADRDDETHERQSASTSASAQLPPVDDDAVSNISFLDLDDGRSTDGDQLSQMTRSKRTTKRPRVFYTCKAFLNYCIQPLRKPLRRIRRASF